ncbi:MAG: WYL domain-containing protein, partial [Gammaproteobacteria bacterium]
MTDTLQRQWYMLRLIPREPRRVSVDEIQKQLAAADFGVSARTLQRDLIALSGLFPLVMDDRNRPYGWSWKKDGRIFDLPGMDPQTALTFKLVEMFLGGVMPPTVRQGLDPHLRNAAEVLKQRPLRRWVERVRVIRSRQTLKAPHIDREVLQ